MALSWFDWLQCIARPLVKVLRVPLNSAAGGLPVGDFVCEAAIQVMDALRSQAVQGSPQEAVAALARAPEDQVPAHAIQIVTQLAPDQPIAVRQTLAAYLVQVPVQIRQALRRPADPSGTTMPGSVLLQEPEHLVPFLPTRLPRFKPGDRPLPGSDWELVTLLGMGGFGEVWKAWKPRFPGIAPRALKFCLDPAARARLLGHEAAVLNQVMSHGGHPGIVQLLDTYLEVDPPCLAYEYVAGSDLAAVIRQGYQGRGAPPREAANIIRELAEIMRSPHGLKPAIVHRDLKPANILVYRADGGKIGFKVADFGIGGLASREALTRLSRVATTRANRLPETVRGSYTLHYASPQQVNNRPPDPRDDVYALGVIWYQLLVGDLDTGRPGGQKWENRLIARGMAQPLVHLLRDCVEDEPGDRPGDAGVLAARLAMLLREQPIPPLIPVEPVPTAAAPVLAKGPPPLPPRPHSRQPGPLPEPASSSHQDPMWVNVAGAAPPGPVNLGQRIRGPAIALLIAAALAVLVDLVMAFAALAPYRGFKTMGFVATICGAAGVGGALSMLLRRSYRWALAGCLLLALSQTFLVVAAVADNIGAGPTLIVVGMFLLSLPPGIWALLVLRRSDVKAAFRSP